MDSKAEIKGMLTSTITGLTGLTSLINRQAKENMDKMSPEEAQKAAEFIKENDVFGKMEEAEQKMKTIANSINEL